MSAQLAEFGEQSRERPYRVFTMRYGQWVLAVEFPSVDQARAFARCQSAMLGAARVKIRGPNELVQKGKP